jgi:hypothetical protein
LRPLPTPFDFQVVLRIVFFMALVCSLLALLGLGLLAAAGLGLLALLVIADGSWPVALGALLAALVWQAARVATSAPR